MNVLDFWGLQFSISEGPKSFFKSRGRKIPLLGAQLPSFTNMFMYPPGFLVHCPFESFQYFQLLHLPKSYHEIQIKLENI